MKMTDSEQYARVAGLLLESARAWERHAPGDAAAMRAVAAGLCAPSKKPRLLSKAAKKEASAKATAWVLRVYQPENEPRPPQPRIRDYYAAARAAPELEGVPIEFIKNARPAEWTRGPGRPRNVRIMCNETFTD
jgi:hypothetical protein